MQNFLVSLLWNTGHWYHFYVRGTEKPLLILFFNTYILSQVFLSFLLKFSPEYILLFVFTCCQLEVLSYFYLFFSSSNEHNSQKILSYPALSYPQFAKYSLLICINVTCHLLLLSLVLCNYTHCSLCLESFASYIPDLLICEWHDQHHEAQVSLPLWWVFSIVPCACIAIILYYNC